MLPVPRLATTASGTIGSAAVVTAAPVDVTPRPVFAMALVAAFAAAALAIADGEFAGARHVRNELPDGATWDGLTGLLVDEKQFAEMIGAREPPGGAAPTLSPARAPL